MSQIELTPVELGALAPITYTGQLIVNAVEQVWFTTKKRPTADKLAILLQLDLEEVERELANEAVIQQLRKKGIVTQLNNDDLLTTKQLLAINMVLTREDKRTLREKLKEANTTPTEWNGWLALPHFAKYVESKMNTNFNGSAFNAYKTIADLAEQGDLPAAKLMLEVTGRYTPRSEVTVNVNGLLTQVVEIISVYLTPSELEEVANKLEVVYSTYTGKALTVG